MTRLEAASEQLMNIRKASYKILWANVTAADRTRKNPEKGITKADVGGLFLSAMDFDTLAGNNKKALDPHLESLKWVQTELAKLQKVTPATSKGKREAIALLGAIRLTLENTLEKFVKDAAALNKLASPPAKS